VLEELPLLGQREKGKVSLLTYYILTPKVLGRWRRTVALQRELLPSWESMDKVIIASPDCIIKPEVQAEVVRMDFFDKDGLVRFSPVKNAAIDRAVAGGYDWLLDMDADTVLVKPVTVFPETGIGSVRVYLGKEGEGIREMRSKVVGGETLEYQGSSRFLTNRDVFTKLRYDERMAGYAGEDFDYFETAAHTHKFYMSETDGRCVHFWHPLTDRGYGKWTFRERRRERGEGDW
jgi:hypothetical protein